MKSHTLLLLATFIGFGHADTLINTYPTGSTSNIVATASTEINSNNLAKLTLTTNNNGGAQDFFPNVQNDPTDGTETNGTQAAWRATNTTAGAAASEWIQWDLGASYTLGTIRVWNYNDFSRYASGIHTLDIYVSNVENPGDPEGDGAANWTHWGVNSTFPAAPGLSTYTGFDLETAVGLSLPATPIRYVRFAVNTTFVGDGTDVGGGLLGGQNASLSQIEFFEGGGGGTPVDPAITSFSVSGNTATVTMSGDDSVDYWCASSTDLTDWTTEETALKTGTATPIPSPFNTSGGTLTFDVDVTGDSSLFLRIQDIDPSP